jgi:hypothetical protein
VSHSQLLNNNKNKQISLKNYQNQQQNQQIKPQTSQNRQYMYAHNGKKSIANRNLRASANNLRIT